MNIIMKITQKRGVTGFEKIVLKIDINDKNVSNRVSKRKATNS